MSVILRQICYIFLCKKSSNDADAFLKWLTKNTRNLVKKEFFLFSFCFQYLLWSRWVDFNDSEDSVFRSCNMKKLLHHNSVFQKLKHSCRNCLIVVIFRNDVDRVWPVLVVFAADIFTGLPTITLTQSTKVLDYLRIYCGVWFLLITIATIHFL